MFIACCVLAVLYSGMLIFCGIAKPQHTPEAVQIIHELTGVPPEWFPVLSACELAGGAPGRIITRCRRRRTGKS